MNDAEKELVERLFAEVERLQAIVEEDNEVLRNSIDTIAELRIQNRRLRSIADDLYAYIVSDADISLKVIEEQMDWREEE